MTSKALRELREDLIGAGLDDFAEQLDEAIKEKEMSDQKYEYGIATWKNGKLEGFVKTQMIQVVPDILRQQRERYPDLQFKLNRRPVGKWEECDE